MDPLTAFSLAGTIIQFLDFTTKLIQTTVEIHGSIKGLSSEVSSLEEVYTALSEFSSQLETSNQNSQGVTTEFRAQIISLNRLSTSCKEDCDKLLKIVDNLTSGGPRRRWKSFKAAITSLRKQDEIAILEKRLSRTQSALTLCICEIAKYVISKSFLAAHGRRQPDEIGTLTSRFRSQFHAHHSQELRQLRAECGRLQLNQAQKLDEVMNELHDIHLAVKTKKSTSGSKFSQDEITQIQSELAKTIATERSVSLDQEFLKNLTFDQIEQRHMSITKAHDDTLEWIFDSATASTDGEKLLHWLKFGKGIFWVSGKAGSGKSTLMKFVAGHNKTQSALEQWAGPNEIFVISHYFWWAGTQMQKSQQGLLQTLLFGIFRQCPDLMKDICEPRWSQHATVHPVQWSLDELRSVFQDISKRTDLKVNFCFFIDGLDEYDGDHIDICSVLQDLANESPHFKFCLSSRPWNVFENIFGRQPSQKIYVHDLTEDDIRQYARSRLCEHQRWNAFASQTPDTQVLVARITKRARGVFLWVFLVTRLLREGMSNNDSLTDLFRRLDSFPSDLEAFFKHMLQSVDPFYAPKMSTTLQIALAATRKPLSLHIYGFHEDEFEDAEYSFKLAVRPLPRNTAQIAQRINGWCQGLLEVQGGTVQFLHRTVIDFLRTRDIVDFLAQNSPSNFCATRSLLKAHHALLKSSKKFRPKVLDHILEYACWDLDTPRATHPPEEVFAILDDTDSCLREMQEQGRACFSGTAQYYFRHKLIMFSVVPYLSKRIPQEPEYFLGFEKSPLSLILDASRSLETEDDEQQFQRRWLSTIKCLLENGEDPNAVWGHSKSPWETLVSRTYTWPGGQSFTRVEPKDVFLQFLEGKLFSLFLQRGADPNASVTCHGFDGSFLVSSAWGLFLTLGANLSAGNERIRARYLEELDAFLLHGADMEHSISGHAVSGDLTRKHETSIGEAFSLACYYAGVLTTQHKGFEQFLERVHKRLSSVAKVQETEGISDWELVIMPPSNIPRFRKLV